MVRPSTILASGSGVYPRNATKYTLLHSLFPLLSPPCSSPGGREHRLMGGRIGYPTAPQLTARVRCTAIMGFSWIAM